MIVVSLTYVALSSLSLSLSWLFSFLLSSWYFSFPCIKLNTNSSSFSFSLSHSFFSFLLLLLPLSLSPSHPMFNRRSMPCSGEHLCSKYFQNIRSRYGKSYLLSYLLDSNENIIYMQLLSWFPSFKIVHLIAVSKSPNASLFALVQPQLRRTKKIGISLLPKLEFYENQNNEGEKFNSVYSEASADTDRERKMERNGRRERETGREQEKREEREMGRGIRVRNSRGENESDNQVSTESSSAHHLTAALDWVTQFIPKWTVRAEWGEYEREW